MARFAKRFPAIFYCFLALQVLESRRNNRKNERFFASTNQKTSPKKRKHTRLIIIDSQVVKNGSSAWKESKGFCLYKATNGIKRHLAVDTLGMPFFVHCTKASFSDDQGLIELLKKNLEYFKSKPVNIPKITILLDNGYNPKRLMAELKKFYEGIDRKIKFKLSPKPSKKEKSGKVGFVPVQTRWVIERSNSWMEKARSLVKNFERTLFHATQKINLCFIRLMLKRLHSLNGDPK